MTKFTAALKGSLIPATDRVKALARAYEFLLSIPDCPEHNDIPPVPGSDEEAVTGSDSDKSANVETPNPPNGADLAEKG